MDAKPWRIELLGCLCASFDDIVIRRFPTQKSANLLAFLAVYPNRSHPREEIAEMLWPGADLAVGRPRLRRLLNRLRGMFDTLLPEGESVILASGQRTIQLNARHVETDVAEFERLAEVSLSISAFDQAAQLQRAYELYRGDFLPGFYEEWVAGERRRLSDLHCSVLSQIANLAEREGLLDKAAAAYAKLAALDPLQEEHHFSLIRLYGQKGQIKRALDQYETLERILKDQFGDEPSLATKDIMDRIRRREPSGESVEVGSTERAPGARLAPVLPQLPTPDSRLFGREEVLSDAIRQIVSGDSRLTTLVGLGGCGKTRLAVEAGHRVAGEFSGAVWFVSFADVADAGQIPLAIMRGLNVVAPPDMAPSKALTVALARRGKALLILDNFEHLARKGRNFVQNVLAGAPDLRVLVTSIYKLNVDGEQVVSVQPLASPSPPFREAELLKCSSVQLFADRAKAADPDFALGPENAEAVGRLCQKLEGIPLAIELAAAAASAMTPDQMLAGISRRFEVLVTEDVEIPARHRSLASVVDYGRHLLSPEAQSFFLKLGVFEGGWAREAAVYVCETPDAVTFLDELANRSLVQRPGNADESDPRYGMLETIREYTRRELADGDNLHARSRHADYFAQSAVEAALHAGKADQAKWLARLKADHDNLISALAWHRDSGGASASIAMAVSLRWYWEQAGPLSEGREWLESLLGLAGGYLSAELLASALSSLGNIAFYQGDFPYSLEMCERALAIRRGIEDLTGVGNDLCNLSNVCILTAKLDRARSVLEEARVIAAEIGDRALLARALHGLGNVELEQRHYAKAKPFFEQSLLIHRALGNKERETSCLTKLGILAGEQKRFVLAGHYFEECLHEAHELASGPHIASSKLNLAIVVGRQGQWRRATLLIGEALKLQGDAGMGLSDVPCLIALARLASVRGEPKVAAVLLGGADCLSEQNRSPIVHTNLEDRLEAEEATLALLTAEEFEGALSEGKSMGRERSIKFALDWIESAAGS